jgi:translation initiation factor eIF-2B subunit epsilon
MLDYTIEWLASTGVEELFVFCVHHAKQVQEYVSSSTWTSVIKVMCVVESSILNAGDALRELDKRGLIRSDPFIMVSGDVVTNVDVRGALAEHKRRKKRDPSAIMTLLLKQRDPMSNTRQVCDDLLVGMNRKTNQVRR